MGSKILVVLGVLVLVSGLTLGVISYLGNSAQAEIVKADSVTGAPRTVAIIPVTGTMTVEPTVESTDVVVEPTPTLEPKVVGYVLDKTIDLSSNDPVALTLHLPDGRLMSTNWAGLIHDEGLNATEQKAAFAPLNGVIYSYLGDVLTTWTHSGTGVGGKPYFFATNLDFYIRKTAENQTVSLPEALVKIESLKGVTAYLCQVPSGTVAFLDNHDANSQCSGKEIELEIVAVAVIPHEMMSDYNSHIYDLNAWMTENFPGNGFESLSKDNGWLIRFCVGRFTDQVDDGTPWYSHNAGVIGFKIKDGE